MAMTAHDIVMGFDRAVCECWRTAGRSNDAAHRNADAYRVALVKLIASADKLRATQLGFTKLAKRYDAARAEVERMGREK